MTPGARVAAAIEVLDQILAGQSAEQALTRWARGSRFAGSKDRAAVRDHVFQALRCKRSYAALGGAQTGRGLMIGALRAQDIPTGAVFSGEGYAPAPLNHSEEQAGDPPENVAETLDLPDWIWTEFEASLGEQAVNTATALKQRAPVVLRANVRMKIIEQIIDTLQQNGIEVQRDPIAETALIVTEGQRKVAGSQAYLNGLVELQDGSSQAAIEALTLGPQDKVLDYCAGGGGKALAMAARGVRQCFAHDSNPERMKDIAPRADRAGVSVQVLQTSELSLHGPYDLVLCDVPCTGSGTWRRTPDAKWQLTPERLAALCEMQAGILRDAALLVSPGGRLAYTTCSVLRRENQDQLERFLLETRGWSLVSDQTWPVGDSGDGFYLAQLSRD